MTSKKKQITGGLYLVLDPSMERNDLLEKLEQALKGGVEIIQVWNHWPDSFSLKDKEELVAAILNTTSDYQAPVLINEEWELLKTTGLHGVHFDEIPDEYQQIREEIDRDFIAGITCSNKLNVIRWADQNDFDYISFCAMFPSGSVDSCEIVQPETVRKAREITDLPLFVSGGITPDNLPDLQDLDFQGVAVISGILGSDSPHEAAGNYRTILKKIPTS